jgi:hypothetical protein
MGAAILLANIVIRGLSQSTCEHPPGSTTSRGSGVSVQLIKTHGLNMEGRKTTWRTNSGEDKEAEEMV